MKSELTSKIMKKIVIYEDKRTHLWLIGLMCIMTVVILVSLSLLINGIIRIAEYKVLEPVVTLVQEDMEIVKDYWQDTVIVLITEIPDEIIYFVLILATIIVVYLFSRKGISIFRNRLRALEKYKNDN